MATRESEADRLNLWKARTELCFNVLKIMALFVTAGWTYYQWDKTIFPKESHEAFARRASRRTDLDLKVSKLDFAVSDGGAAMNVSGVLSLENTKDFPVLVRFSPAPRFEFGETAALAAGQTGIPATKWSASMEIPPSEAFGAIDEAHPPVIEAKGKAELAFTFPVQGAPTAGAARRLFRLRVPLELRAIDPRTGEEIAGSIKTKQALVQGQLGRGTTAGADAWPKQIVSWGFGPPR